jgi:hypothetical protein
MFNHHPHAHISSKRGFDETTQALVMKTYCGCDAGSQLFISYGAHQNWELLMYYNFIIPNNAYDTISFNFYPPEGDDEAQHQRKLELIESLGLSCEHFIRKNRIPNRVRVAIRICVCNAEELQLVSGNPQAAHSVISEENERNANQALREALRALLDAFPTTLDEDKELLEEEDLSADRRLAIEFRVSQKEIISSLLQQ